MKVLPCVVLSIILREIRIVLLFLTKNAAPFSDLDAHKKQRLVMRENSEVKSLPRKDFLFDEPVESLTEPQARAAKEYNRTSKVVEYGSIFAH